MTQPSLEAALTECHQLLNAITETAYELSELERRAQNLVQRETIQVLAMPTPRASHAESRGLPAAVQILVHQKK